MNKYFDPLTGDDFDGFLHLVDGMLVRINKDQLKGVSATNPPVSPVSYPDHFLPIPDRIPDDPLQDLVKEKMGDAPLISEPGLRGCTPRTWSRWDHNWQGDQYAEHMAQDFAGVVGPGDSITVNQTFTVTWQCTVNVGFSVIKDLFSVGGGFGLSESRTTSVSATVVNRTPHYGRVEFVPLILYRDGWLTMKHRDRTCEEWTQHDRQWTTVRIPQHKSGMADGLYRLKKAN